MFTEMNSNHIHNFFYIYKTDENYFGNSLVDVGNVGNGTEE